jgi:hypothetical protein
MTSGKPKRVIVWNGRKNVSVRGRLLPFPFKVADRPVIHLFTGKAGGKIAKWWIYYGTDHPTGHFKTMEAAISWIKGGGR